MVFIIICIILATLSFLFGIVGIFRQGQVSRLSSKVNTENQRKLLDNYGKAIYQFWKPVESFLKEASPKSKGGDV